MWPQELQAIRSETDAAEDPEVTARLMDDDLHHWLGRIKGPTDTCYDGGYFFLDIIIPPEYPYSPPKVR